jgi:hypothetical protein
MKHRGEARGEGSNSARLFTPGERKASRGFGGEVFSALAFHLWGRLFTSNLSENFLNATPTQSSSEKSKNQRSAESRGFSTGTPVSSHRESWQGGLGKRAHSNWHMLLWWACMP